MEWVTMTWVWLAVFIILMVIELATLGLTTVWFAGGAVVALIASITGVNIYVQLALFVLVTIALLVFTRPYAQKYINKHHIATNVETMAGKTAVVTEEIDNLHGLGQVRVDGMEWTARGEGEEAHIVKGAKVKVVEVSGVKLIVTPEA